MATQTERSTETRGRIIEAARELFVKFGYDSTLTEQILATAGVSRGAMYHHFATKKEVFEAVFVQVSDEAIGAAVGNRAPLPSPLEELVRACLAWLKQVRAPAVGAILIEQGPQVLGWKRARDLEAKTSLGLMTRSLELAVAAGELKISSVSLTARFLNAALAEAALAALHEPQISQKRIENSIRQLIAGLGREQT